MNCFSERLKKLRESSNLTQLQLAEILNIGRASISNYELGIRMPDIDVLLKIANYFGVSTDYLTGRSDIKNSNSEELKKQLKAYQDKINSLKIKLQKALDVLKED